MYHFNENNFSEIAEFVLKCIYNETNITCSNLATSKSWNKMKKKNTARLNPDRNSLLRVMRANYQIFVFEDYHNPSPFPFGNGWERDVNRNTVPVKSTTTSAPDTIQDLREIHTTQNDEENSDSEIEYTDEEMDSGSDDEF